MGQLGKIFGDIKQHIASALGRPLTKTPDKAVLPGPGTPEAAEDGTASREQPAAISLGKEDAGLSQTWCDQDVQAGKRQRSVLEEHYTQGVCRRRVEAGAISSPAKPQAEAESGWQGSHSALRNTNLFPVRLDKSAQVTPSLQKQARAKKAGQQNTDHAVSSLQPPLPPVTSQYDPVSYVEEGTIVPQPRPRSSVSRHTNSTDLVDNMRKAHISGPQARSEENDVEVLEHTGPASAGFQLTMTPAWHKHTDRYQQLDKDWEKEEQRINAQDTYNQKLAEARTKLETSRIKGDERMLQIEVQTQQLSAAERRVQQATARRRTVFGQSSSYTQRTSVQQPAEKATPALDTQGDEVVMLTDSDDEPAEQRVSAEPEAEKEDDGGAVDLVSDSDEESSVSDSEENEEQEEGLPDGGKLHLNMPERHVDGSLLDSYEQLAMRIRHYETVVSHARAHVGISGEEFHTMAPKEWLGDACINMYIALLQDRDKRWFQDGSQKRSRCLFMNSHFLAKLCQEPGGYDYSKVRRWTADRKRKALAIDYYGGIEDLDKMVLPVHLGNHWTCAALNFEEQRIEYYDSLGGVDRTTINSLLRWVEDEYEDKYKKPLPEKFQTKNWTQHLNPKGTPQQLNGHDCGVFAMMSCNYVAADRDFDYTQDEVHSFFRKMCCLECYCMKLRSIDL